MAYRHIEPVSKQVTIVVGLTVVGLMAFGLALSFYRNVLFDQTLATIGEKNDELRGTIEAGKRELEYYESAQYKDKYAKENLGKVTPGEQILIFTQQVDRTEGAIPQQNDTVSDQQEAAYLELLRQMPILEHWKLFLFHKEKIEDLKRSFYGKE
jgi:cell division protein FtsB